MDPQTKEAISRDIGKDQVRKRIKSLSGRKQELYTAQQQLRTFRQQKQNKKRQLIDHQVKQIIKKHSVQQSTFNDSNGQFDLNFRKTARQQLEQRIREQYVYQKGKKTKQQVCCQVM